MNDTTTIINLYREAKNKPEEIEILAQLYDTTPEEIAQLLISHGYDAQMKKKRKRYEPVRLISEMDGSIKGLPELARESGEDSSRIYGNLRKYGYAIVKGVMWRRIP